MSFSKLKYPLLFFCYFVLQIGFAQSSQLPVDSILAKAGIQLLHALSQNKQTSLFPRSYNLGQSVVLVKSDDWTSGFFSGCLWYMYEATHDPFWKSAAEKWTNGLEKEKTNEDTHDLGFMLNCSFGNGYRLTKNKNYKEVLLQAARSLASRYNSKAGCIRSWDHGDWGFPVIIDNMMNLELLFRASKISGDKSFYNIATSHARQTLKNHFRSNGSSYHVVDYEPETGKVISRTTAQGYANESSWARGQAWGLYGFTMAYRETKDILFLKQADKIAMYILKNLPKNKIPYWDFNAPNIPFEFQDASAAAIIASALLELSKYSKEHADIFFEEGSEILKTLSKPPFFANENTNGNFILKGGVGNGRKKLEVNVPLIYADYYFLEALIRYKELKKAEK